MSVKKPFLSGLGVGLIVASAILETTHWANQTAAIEISDLIPKPTATMEVSNSAPSSNSPVASNTVNMDELKAELAKSKADLASAKKKLAVKPTMKLYIPNGSNAWSVSALLKEAGIIPAQNEFINEHQKYAKQVQFKKGFYGFKEKMTNEDVLRVFGAPIPTATTPASASPTVVPKASPK